MEMNKISVTVTGSSRVDLVNNLRAFADNLDGTPAGTDGKVTGKTAAAKPAAAKKQAAPPPVDEDDDFKADDGGAEPAGFDDDAAEEAPAEEEGFEEEAPPKKAAPAKKTAAKKKITLDDVNDACKAHAAAKGRPATLAILQKKFKTQSVTALKPEQYEACISAMAVN
ncbi:MAG: hypothetical protein OEW15_18785 [Nitrospirota bacterium]|nr:hypothetical protein [Nitrospirota bacterium]